MAPRRRKFFPGMPNDYNGTLDYQASHDGGDDHIWPAGACTETWLSGSSDEAFKLARSHVAEQMRIVQSGSERKDLLAA